MVSWLVGGRDVGDATEFINDLPGRLAARVQSTTDGDNVYAEAIEGAFGCQVDFAMLVKLYGENADGETGYSPAQCVGARKQRISGDRDPRRSPRRVWSAGT
jgi:hypothetical protein